MLITGCQRYIGTPLHIAKKIKETIKYELGLTVSIGVSFNKIFAKLGSDMKKPDAVTVIPKESFKEIVWDLPASDMLGIGRATEKKLSSVGIYTIGQIAQFPVDFFQRRLGKCGVDIWRFANGLDTSPVTVRDNDLRESGRRHLVEHYGKGLTGTTVRGIHMLLHEIMEYALKEKMILSNPTNGTTIPKIDPTELMVLDEKQLKIFISAIQSNEQWRDFFYLEIMTGLRRGEICALKWSDFDIVERKLHVNRSVTPHGAIGKAKTCYSERVIKLPYSVYQVLVNRKTSAQSEWMFPQPKDLSKPIMGESALRQLKVILKSSGLPNIRFHDLRHTFATHAVSAGIDPKTLSSILGHSKASFSLDRYGHVTAEMQKGAAKTIGHFFNELVGEEVDQWQKEEEDSHHNSKAEDGEQE